MSVKKTVGYLSYICFNSPQDFVLLVYGNIVTKINKLSKFCGYDVGMFDRLRRLILSKVFRRHYWRTGKCKGCGECCTHIYVKHFKHVLSDEKEFERLQGLFGFYKGLRVIGKDELGLIFECRHLDAETKRCKIHFWRPAICRRYPQEELFAMGGTLSENCGFKMEPIIPFKNYLRKTG